MHWWYAAPTRNLPRMRRHVCPRAAPRRLAAAAALAALACAPTRARPEVPHAMQPVTIPAADPGGPVRQVRVLHDGPAMKLVSIRLRGVDLPPHHSEFTVVIQAVEGAGAVVVGGRREPVDATHAVVLPPRAVHEVLRDGEGDLVLLVTHVKGAIGP